MNSKLKKLINVINDYQNLDNDFVNIEINEDKYNYYLKCNNDYIHTIDKKYLNNLNNNQISLEGFLITCNY